MHENLSSADFLDLTYRADNNLIIGRWLRSVNEAELHAGYASLRRLALQHKCAHWLIDARRRTDRRQNGPEWVTTEFLPQLQREMGCPLHVCFLVLPNHLEEAEQDPISAFSPTSEVQFARFLDEGAANAWLAAHQSS